MKQLYFAICILTLSIVFTGCDKKSALEKAEPWSIEGVKPTSHTVDRPQFRGYDFEIYEVEAGEGPTPIHGQTVQYDFSAFTESGTAFSTTIDGKPGIYTIGFQGGAIIGLQEAFMYVRKGGKYRFSFPPELAYGDQYQFGGRVPPNSRVFYDVTIVSISE